MRTRQKRNSFHLQFAARSIFVSKIMSNWSCKNISPNKWYPFNTMGPLVQRTLTRDIKDPFPFAQSVLIMLTCAFIIQYRQLMLILTLSTHVQLNPPGLKTRLENLYQNRSCLLNY